MTDTATGLRRAGLFTGPAAGCGRQRQVALVIPRTCATDEPCAADGRRGRGAGCLGPPSVRRGAVTVPVSATRQVSGAVTPYSVTVTASANTLFLPLPFVSDGSTTSNKVLNG